MEVPFWKRRQVENAIKYGDSLVYLEYGEVANRIGIIEAKMVTTLNYRKYREIMASVIVGPYAQAHKGMAQVVLERSDVDFYVIGNNIEEDLAHDFAADLNTRSSLLYELVTWPYQFEGDEIEQFVTSSSAEWGDGSYWLIRR